MRKLLLLLLLLFMFVIPGCNHDTIEHVVLKEEYDENGFNLELGYHTKKPLIIANVARTFELHINNVLQKRITLKFTEFFEMGQLPANNNPPNNSYSPADWAQISSYAGKNFFKTDKICAGPAYIAQGGGDTFKVIIKSEHELFTGGTLQGQNAHVPGNPGASGYLETDANGQGPSVTNTDSQGNVTPDAQGTQAWKDRNAPKGTVTKQGKSRLTITVTHTGNWDKTPQDTKWSVDWEYKRKIGAGNEFKKNDSASNTEPKSGPAPTNSCRR